MTSELGSEPSHGGARDPDLEAGAKVGEYVVAEKIGAGGFGAVYRAEHPLIGKVVAIKVLGRKLSADPEMVSRFVAEARSVNQIGSKYIIDIFGFGELDDGRQYYVMELLDGMPLDEHLDGTGVVGLTEAIPILRGIAKALDAAHGSGIAHRDLKPENVFLVADEQGMYRPKLLDFGIAKLMGEQQSMHKTRTGAPIGTPFYMSPEQCRGKGVDHRTDIYAFGCMTYRMLTGQVPFDSDSYMDILFKQIQSEPEPPSRVNPALPPGIDAAIAHMMAKDPDARPASLAVAVREIEAAAALGGVEIPTGGPSGMVTPLPAAPRPATTPRRPEGFSSVDMVAPTLDSDSMQPITVGPARTRASTLVIAALAVLALVGGATAFFALNGSKDAAPAVADDDVGGAEPIELEPEPEPEPEPPIEPEPASPFVNVEIHGVPAGTKILAPTGHFVIAPAPIQLPRGDEPLSISLEAEGYEPATIEITPTESRAVTAELTPVVAKKRTREPTRRKRRPPPRRERKSDKDDKDDKDSIEDPFR